MKIFEIESISKNRIVIDKKNGVSYLFDMSIWFGYKRQKVVIKFFPGKNELVISANARRKKLAGYPEF